MTFIAAIPGAGFNIHIQLLKDNRLDWFGCAVEFWIFSTAQPRNIKNILPGKREKNKNRDSFLT